jgi:16S rRNA (adenine1518-N6/adenine1519-N6)-dimethyltransferase
MFQKEVAERIVAKPGGKAYGRLALLAQWRTDARVVMTLPPEAFVPPPKIHSAVVHLTALPEPRYPADPAVLSRVTAAGFNQRRKMLRSSLKGCIRRSKQLLEQVGIPPPPGPRKSGWSSSAPLPAPWDEDGQVGQFVALHLSPQ